MLGIFLICPLWSSLLLPSSLANSQISIWPEFSGKVFLHSTPWQRAFQYGEQGFHSLRLTTLDFEFPQLYFEISTPKLLILILVNFPSKIKERPCAERQNRIDLEVNSGVKVKYILQAKDLIFYTTYMQIKNCLSSQICFTNASRKAYLRDGIGLEKALDKAWNPVFKTF